MLQNGTATDALTKRPPCDFCGEPAGFDGKTTAGPWAYMCKAHYDMHGIGLGLGRGQRLIIRGEALDSVDE